MTFDPSKPIKNYEEYRIYPDGRVKAVNDFIRDIKESGDESN